MLARDNRRPTASSRRRGTGEHREQQAGSPAGGWLVRRAVAADAPALAELDSLCHVLGSAGWSLAQFQLLLQPPPPPPHHLLLVCVSAASDGPPGTAGTLPVPLHGFASAVLLPGEVQLENLAVHPGMHGRGVGTLLLRSLLEAGRGGENDFFLEVKEGNRAALRLYEGAGFLKVGLRRRYYPDGSHAVIMQRTPGHTRVRTQ